MLSLFKLIVLVFLSKNSIAKSDRDGRLIGGGGVDNDIELYDCPCGCHVLSIQGTNATQFLPSDDRCEIDDPPPSNIGGHIIICPCGCGICTPKNTTGFVYPSKKCSETALCQIDGMNIDCPCSCNGTTSQGTIYELPQSYHCPWGLGHYEEFSFAPEENLENDTDDEYGTTEPLSENYKEEDQEMDNKVNTGGEMLTLSDSLSNIIDSLKTLSTHSFESALHTQSTITTIKALPLAVMSTTKQTPTTLVTATTTVRPFSSTAPPSFSTISEAIIHNPDGNEVILTKHNNEKEEYVIFQKPSEFLGMPSRFESSFLPLSGSPVGLNSFFNVVHQSQIIFPQMIANNLFQRPLIAETIRPLRG